jgi:DNA-damage-inducible protein D
MTDKLAEAGGSSSPFDAIRKLNEHGREYWSARDLMPHLGYEKWSNFRTAIGKARAACEQAGHSPEHHFAEAGKVIVAGRGAKQEIQDFSLSRFACYLIAMNGDPGKPEIALAQAYFAIQTRRQELSDAERRDAERCELREQTKQEFKALSGAAQDAGVSSPMFGVFHDAGYKGMYGGLGREAIMRTKGISPKENLLDRMDSTELAANQFRMTQAREKLARERIQGERRAIEAHEQVGREVRKAIKKIGGTMPEQIPAAEPIKEVRKRLKKTEPKLELDGEHARGLLGDGDPKQP